MNDTSVPISKIVTICLWGAVLATLLTAWGVTFAGHQHTALMLGLTAGVTSAAAAVHSVRCFTMRTHLIIRASLRRPEGSEGAVHSVH